MIEFGQWEALAGMGDPEVKVFIPEISLVGSVGWP